MKSAERRPGLTALRSFDEIGVLCALIALCLVFTATTDTFFSRNNLTQVARQASTVGILSVGMVFVLTLGEVDLSVGSILTLVNVLTAVCLRDGWPLELALVAGLVAGAACGLVNGALSVLLRIPMIIVTLGTMSMYRGLALVISNSTPISQFSKQNWLFDAGGGALFGVLPASVAVMVVVGILGHVLLARTAFGRRVQAIGSNLQAARFSGIRMVRHRLCVMTLMGSIAAIGSILALAFLQSADPSTGPGMELYVIASVVIGGTALNGGSGSILGAILGSLIIAVIRNGLVLLGLTAYWSMFVTGAMIVAAVAIDYFIKRR
jgi:ribose transport system permease protein